MTSSETTYEGTFIGDPELPDEIEGFPAFGRIALSRMHNTRDLGGMPTADGRRIRPNRLIRSGSLAHAAVGDCAELVGPCEMRRIVDFRTDAEREHDPTPFEYLPDVVAYDLPVFEESAVGITHESTIGEDLAALRGYSGDPFAIVSGLYEKSLLSDEGQKAFGEFFNVLLGAESGATLWHCTEGKDRTGLAAMLLEEALGVPRDSIRADYLATNLFVRNRAEKLLDALARKGMLKAADADMEALMYAVPAYLDRAYKVIEEHYGSPQQYLADALAVGPAERGQLQAMYLV